jgi:hypothetical protein
VVADPSCRCSTDLVAGRQPRALNAYRWQGPYLIGRVTVALLHINDEYRIELREGLIEEGVFPPEMR